MTANGEFPDFREDFGNEDPPDREESLEEENSEESLIVYGIPFYFNWDMKAARPILHSDKASWPTISISFYNVSRLLPKV